MSVNFKHTISPILKLKMLNNEEKVVGLVKKEAQMIITLPNINEFSIELLNAIQTSSKNIECFIITASEKLTIEKVINKYELPKSIISLDFRKFAESFNLNNSQDKMKKSLIMIDKSCHVARKTIL